MNDTPSSLGTLIDQRFALRVTRMAKGKEVEELKREERGLDDQIMEKMRETDQLVAGGKTANVSLNPTTVSHVVDWDKVHEFIRESGHWHLMQKRISEPAYREMLTLEIQVPGVEPTTLTKLSLTKVSKK